MTKSIQRSLLLIALLASQKITTSAFTASPPQTKHFNSLSTLREHEITQPRKPTSTQLSLSINPQNELVTYFLQTCINVGVPAIGWIVVIAFAANAFKSSAPKKVDSFDGTGPVEELYSDLFGEGAPNGGGPGDMIPSFLKGPQNQKKIRNWGIPSETYITVTKWNDKLNSYQYSLTSAVEGKAKAAKTFRSQTFDAALKRVLPASISITDKQRNELLESEADFLKIGSELISDIQLAQRALTNAVLEQEMKKMDVKVGELDPSPLSTDAIDVNATSGFHIPVISDMMKDKTQNKAMKDLQRLNQDLTRLELEFVRDIIEIFGPEHANGIRAAMLGNVYSGNGVGSGSLLKMVQDRPLASLLSPSTENREKRLFFTEFPGDITASQVAELREEVTAMIRAAKPGDEALLVLQSGGGTVTGYGLAAAQLRRLKKAGMKLTICVEQVAASGGYMMCCVADRIVASPFAVLGSIGVISDMPNVYERLKQEGIEFQTVTAGKYKRTLTPTKKPTKEDFDKSQQELQDILTLFKAFVKENRPSLDIDSVATGETWVGDDALERGLCDEINTKDDVLIDFVDHGYDVYQVQYEVPMVLPSGLAGLVPGSDNRTRKSGSFVKRAVRWLVNEIKEEVMGTDSATERVQNRYMMKDLSDAKNRIRAED